MDHFVCVTCGTQFEASETPPDRCPICDEERQYVNPGGQQWTTLEEIRAGHRALVQKKENGLYGIGSSPAFGIGQRALLIRTPEGNILWDCISFIDDTLVDIIESWGGLKAIAISHPHYYTTMVEWSTAFGDVPIYLHSNDRKWVQRPHANITYWEGNSTALTDSVTLHNAGGHFEGGTILHWPGGADGSGALLTGDILQVVPDLRHVSFMYSYPNQIPLNAPAVQRIADVVEPLTFDRIYGAWWGRNIMAGAYEAVQKSAKRYIEAIG